MTENHVKLLHQLKQPVPPNVTLLLEDARSRAEKRHAKRVANRKSASSSRARKKALVEEMAALNARLRRQALILSLLPDLVIVIDSDGRITFCSAQVERVLQFSIDDLIGAKLSDIIVPGSRDKLQNLIQELLSPSSTTQQDETDAAVHLTVDQDMAQQQPDDLKLEKKTKVCQVKKGDGKDTLAELSGDARVVDADAVKNLSFPLSVVQVDPAAAALASSDENDNSDGSNNSKQPSSLTNSLLGISELDGKSPKKDDHGSAKSKSVPNKAKRDSQSSKSCHTSSTESNDAKNLICANANLERNVRWHNKKIMKDKRVGYKDDVLGAAVTANNASARLSSLQHRSSDSSEEDSGYRESNDSREETSSSEGETLSSSNGP